MFQRLFLLLVLIPLAATADQSAVQSSVAAAQSEYKLLILGDSLSAAYNLRQEQGWVSLLQNAWRDRHIEIVDAAISGETTAGGLARLPRLIKQHRPTHILIELGANDGLRGHPIDAMKRNLTAMVELAQAANAVTALQEMRIPTNYGRRYTNMFNAAYHAVGESHGISVIPFFLQDVALDASLMQADGLHPNAAAQPIIAAFMQPKLEAWMALPATAP